MTRTSIKDIAQELGVSTATVSLVLNGKEKNGRVGKEVAARIRQKALEMNYEPNHLARGLRMGKTLTIGLVIADISNLFFANLAFYIQEEAERLGYSVIITNTNESDLKMEKMIHVLRGRSVDGLIVVPTEHGDEMVRDLLKRHTPVVLVDRYFRDLPVGAVTVDNYRASRHAVRYLMDRGCRNIGLVIYKSALQHMCDRKRGYEDLLREGGLYRASLVKEISYSTLADDMVIAMDSLLAHNRPVDGIFFATNTLSMLGIKQLLARQMAVMRDLPVICFDKSDAFDFVPTPIPYIQQPIREMGVRAVELLVEQMTRQPADTEGVLVELPAELRNME
jgi:LacI family transcriptional regulator